MRKLVTSALCILLVFSAFAAKVDTVNVYSASMNKYCKAVVVLPQQFEGKLPALYLLHGHGGNYRNWGATQEVKDIADTYQMAVVCPDGASDSWYWDSPVDASFRYETFVSKELVNFIDKNYPTINDRNARFITGLSMGGHGALFLAFRHSELFGACGSMSGGVDIRPFPEKWDMAKRIGAQSEYPDRWSEYSVMGNLHLLTPNRLKIIIDCGSEDFFYDVNKRLHEELKYRNIPHDFISRPGAHNWDYWKNALKFQALFFSEYFKNRKK